MASEKKEKDYARLLLEKVNPSSLFPFLGCGLAVEIASIESAPHPGIKHDKEKARMDLLPFESLDAISDVLTHGAKKYAPDNWKIVPEAKSRYEAALLRHFSAYKRGETLDPESGLSHLAHMGCNALFLIYLEKKDIVNK